MPGANQYKAADFIRAIPGTGGIISAIARYVGCDWHTAKKYIDTHPSVKRAYQAEKEGLLDLAEVKLIERVKAGDAWAIKYLLGKLGAHRGFGDRIDVNLSGGIAVAQVTADDMAEAAAKATDWEREQYEGKE